MSMLPLFSIIFCVSGITTGNETSSPSDVLGASLALCGTIISILNCYPMISITKALFSVIIETLIFYGNGQENILLRANPSHRERETFTGYAFTTKVFL